MALQKGERYRCLDSNCGCEIEVTKGEASLSATSWVVGGVGAETRMHHIAQALVDGAKIGLPSMLGRLVYERENIGPLGTGLANHSALTVPTAAA